MADLPDLTSQLADSDQQAAERFTKYAHVDPFPMIPSSLLNSADLIDYVAATGMIHPFDPAKLKPASYALPILGKAVWWDAAEERRHVVDIGHGDEFVLEQNAIAFVTLEPMLRVPDYIAIRFNLKVRNVYRGLLLGTGPLVDPGFVGRLPIPLHNLTTNAYRFKGGEDLIWMDFTKLSSNERWSPDTQAESRRIGYYVPFAKATSGHDVEDYIEEAVGQQHVISSISEALSTAEAASQRVRRWTLGGIAGGLLAAGALVAGIIALIVNVFMLRNDIPSRADLDRQRAQIQQLQTSVTQLQTRLRVQTKQSTNPPKAPK